MERNTDTRQHGSIYNLSVAIRPYSFEMVLAIICALLKQLSVIGTAGTTSYVVGLAMTGAPEQQIVELLPLLFLCIFVRALTVFGEMYFAHDVAFRAIRDFRLALFQKISEISPAYTLRKKTGQLGQALISDVEVLELFLAHTFSSFIVAIIVMLIILGILWEISPILALLLIIAAVFIAVVPYSLRKRAMRQGGEVRTTLAEANSLMVEGVQGLREITTLNSKTMYKNRILQSLEALYSAQRSYGRKKGTESMMVHIISGVFVVSVMVVSAYLVAQGKLSMSLYPVAVMLSTVVLAPVSEASSVAQEMGIVFSASNHIQDILHTEPAVHDNGKETCRIAEQNGSNLPTVAFEDVCFGYEEENVLDHVSFQIKSGEKVVLVGHSGAGKSTCANLLLRYYDICKGKISIYGQDIRDISMESLRENISAVQQDTYLFHESIRANIALGCPEADDAAIIRAAKAANAHEFIRKLPDGYDTIAGEHGFQLSGGQRQRISIARALLRDTSIVIMDEAVSALDTENERYIQETIDSKMAGKTMLMIAHRLSTIVAADRIVMLEKGKVTAIGTHEELLRNSEAYRKLIASQLR